MFTNFHASRRLTYTVLCTLYLDCRTRVSRRYIGDSVMTFFRRPFRCCLWYYIHVVVGLLLYFQLTLKQGFGRISSYISKIASRIKKSWKKSLKWANYPRGFSFLWILILQCQCQFYSILTVFKVYIEQKLGIGKSPVETRIVMTWYWFDSSHRLLSS